ncbi:MAG: hypothetical protein AB9834_06305 [Lentimicrobium sp.]
MVRQKACLIAWASRQTGSPTKAHQSKLTNHRSGTGGEPLCMVILIICPVEALQLWSEVPGGRACLPGKQAGEAETNRHLATL